LKEIFELGLVAVMDFSRLTTLKGISIGLTVFAGLRS